MSGGIGDVGGDVGRYAEELFKAAKGIQVRFEHIKPGAESEEVQKISAEATAVLAKMAALMSAHSDDKKLGKKMASMCELFAPVFEANVGRLAEEEVGIHTDLVAQIEVFQKGRFDEKLLGPLVKLNARLNALSQRASELLQSPPEPKQGDRRLVLMARLQEDKLRIAELTRDIEAKRFEAIQEREKKLEEGSRGTGAQYRARVGFEAFRTGTGEAVVSQIKGEKRELWTRDPKLGPQEKTEATRHCEEVVHTLLVDPDKVTVSERVEGGETKYYVKISREAEGKEDEEFELSALTAGADFSHVQLSEEDLEKYVKSPLLFRPSADDARLLRQINDPKRKPPLTQAEKDALLAMTPAQRSIINNYTKEGVYSVVNTILRGDINGVFRAMDEYLSKRKNDFAAYKAKLDAQAAQFDVKKSEFGKSQKQYIKEFEEWRVNKKAWLDGQESLKAKKELLRAKQEALEIKATQAGGDGAQVSEIEAERTSLALEEEKLRKDETALNEQGAKVEAQSRHLDEFRSKIEAMRGPLAREGEQLKTGYATLKYNEDLLKEREVRFKADKKVLLKEALLHASVLNAALAHLPEQDMSVDAQGRKQYLYRCDISLPKKVLDEMVHMGAENTIGWWHGFMSTSHTRPSADFLGKRPTVLTVLDRGMGRNIAPLSDFDAGENEVLLAPMQVQWMGSKVFETDWGKGGEKAPVTMVWGLPVRAVGVGPMRLRTPEDIL